MNSYFVQVGLWGAIGKFQSVDRRAYQRNKRVICRTDRGLESGVVLSASTENSQAVDGQLLREVSPNDEMILARIEKFRDQAFQACQTFLRQRDLSAVLVDVEHLFDGQSLYFYFLGDVSSELDEWTSQLAETYEAKVKIRKFAETLANGCGPDCGSPAGSCGDEGNCNSCPVKTACH